MGIDELTGAAIAVALTVAAIGIVALLFAFLGAMTFSLPTRGRPFTGAFLKSIPLSIVGWILIALAIEMAAERSDTSLQGTCQLSGNYALMMVDAEGSGWVYNRRNESRVGGVKWDKEGIDGVESLQVAGRYILGGRDSHGFRPSRASAVIDNYFVIDSQAESITNLATREQLQTSAVQLGINLELRPVQEVYFGCGSAQPGQSLVWWMLLFVVLFLSLLVYWAREIRSLRPAIPLSRLLP